MACFERICDTKSPMAGWECHYLSFQIIKKGVLSSQFCKKTVFIVSFSGLRRLAMPGVVRAKYVHLQAKPCVKAARAL